MRKFSVLSRLVIGPNMQHRFRTLATLCCIGISVALVAWNLRRLDVVQVEARNTQKQEGRFDAVITPKDFRGGQIDPALIETVRADEAVAEVDAAVRTRARQIEPEGPPQRGPFGGTSVIGTGANEPPQGILEGTWLTQAPNEAVIGQGFKERMKLALGDRLTIGGMGDEVTLTVVGVIPGPPAMVPGVRMMPPANLADVFISLPTAATLNGYGDRPSLLCVVLKDPAAAQEFAADWTDKLADAKPEATVRLLKAENKDLMGAPTGAMQQMLSANATILAFLAALFIIFVTLSTNVRERIRQFAILRALALSRAQLMGMIVIEALLFAVIGWAIGIVLIKAFLVGGSLFVQSSMFSAGPLGWPIVLVSLLASVVGALAAAILPAWQAWRIDPVDILGGRGTPRPRALPWVTFVIGLALIAINPTMIVLARSHEHIREALSHLWGWGPRGFGAPLVGSLAMILGFVLITPMAVVAAERVFGPLVAWILQLDRRFLRQQLTGNLWRTTGTTIALSIGLTLFVTSLVWGYSMLVPFTPTQGLPRMQIAILPAGLPTEAVPEVLATSGIKADQCLPVAVEQPRLTREMLASKPFAHVDPQQQHLLVMGVDPDRAFGNDHPLFDLDFVEGSPAEAARRMAGGRTCIVPDHFATQTGLGLGDSFSVDVPNVPGRQVSYTIVGVASIPGWNWLTKFSETRRRAGRALAMVFVGYDQAREDFALDRVSYFWGNTDGTLPEAGVTDESGTPGKTPAEVLQERLTPLARRYGGVQVDLPEVGKTAVAGQYVKVTDREDVLNMLFNRANSVIWPLTTLPLYTLAICSLAVFNTILASIRGRFWQFGVLRGVGLTGGQLLRLILAESVLICGAACVLSLVAGLGLAWCGTRLSTLFFFFGGHTPSLVLPWSLWIGFLMTFGLCLLAGIIPAILAASREPLKYIQTGPLAM